VRGRVGRSIVWAAGHVCGDAVLVAARGWNSSSSCRRLVASLSAVGVRAMRGVAGIVSRDGRGRGHDRPAQAFRRVGLIIGGTRSEAAARIAVLTFVGAHTRSASHTLCSHPQVAQFVYGGRRFRDRRLKCARGCPSSWRKHRAASAMPPSPLVLRKIFSGDGCGHTTTYVCRLNRQWLRSQVQATV